MRSARMAVQTAVAAAAGVWAVALAAPAAAGDASAVRATLVDPTPLRPVAASALTATSDGDRYVAVSFSGRANRPVEIFDTFTGRRSRLPLGCTPAGGFGATAWLTAGRALVSCGATAKVIDLTAGRAVVDLPQQLEAGGARFARPRYEALGRRWVRASGDCPQLVGCAVLYHDYRTGETRASMHPDGPEFRARRAFYDLDAPELPLVRVCRPAIRYEAGLRHYRPPFYVDRRAGLRRCRDGRLVMRFPQVGDVAADLTSRALAWGVTVTSSPRRPQPFANVYETRRGRLLRWRLPPLAGRRALGTAIVTACEMFALTSRTFGDRGGGVASIRVDRARLPAPRDPRCRG